MTEPEHSRTTPEGHTPEEPAPSELGKRGTPGAGMNGEVPHAADARMIEGEDDHATDDHHTAAHADAAHPDEEHGHDEPRLGPIDWPAWGHAALGVLAGLIVVVMFFVAVA